MKKGPAKKNSAPTPKRKYTKRVKEKDNTGGGDTQLFKIEKFEGNMREVGFRTTPEYQRLTAALQKIKPKEGFVIKRTWKTSAHRIVRELQLEIKIVAIKVAGNDEYVRVVRMS